MRVFHKRKKAGIHDRGSQGGVDAVPDIVYYLGAEAAAGAYYASLRSDAPNPYVAVDSLEHELDYEDPHSQIIIEPSDSAQEESQTSSRLQRIASAFGLFPSKSRGRSVARAGNNLRRVGSPDQFRAYSPAPYPPYSAGSPVQFRRRAGSPELVRSRPSSPYNFYQEERVPSPLHFAQRSRPGSPELSRQLQFAAHSPELQHISRQQRRQREMVGNANYPDQYYLQYQQAQEPYHSMINPHIGIQGYSVLQQPQMYSYY